MIDRHTHIFGSDHVDDPDAVLDLWAKNKMKERGQKKYSEVLGEISHSLPALMRACKVVDKSARAGVSQADADVHRAAAAESIAEICGEDSEKALGDVLFAVCALARQLKLDPEIALNEATDRFIKRFVDLEEELSKQGKTMPLPAEEAAKYWEIVKL